ncbi:hypothetical protein D3C86_1926690 [compost metagenome]
MIPALRDSSSTVCSSHCSWRVRGWVMISVPVLIFAIHLDSSSEISEPAKPNTAQKISRLL